MKILEEKTLLNQEALEWLEERKKEGTGDLGYEQENALTHLQAFSAMPAKKAKALYKELVEAGLTEKQAASVCNIMPGKEDVLKTVLTADKSEVSEDKIKEVMKILKKH